MNVGRRQAGPGTSDELGVAKELVRTWIARDKEFRHVLNDVLDQGREGVLELARREMAEHHAEDADTFSDELMENAEYGVVSLDKSATLVVVTVELEGTERPDPAEFGKGLAQSGWFEDSDLVSFFPAWFPAAGIRKLSPCKARRLLRELASGKPPSMLELADPNSEDAIMLVGIDGTIGVMDWDTHYELFEAWKEGVLEANPGIADIGNAAPPSEILRWLE
jgi:predicted transcriptional regulator